MKKVLEVQGMTCGHCVKRVTKVISGFEGTSEVEVDLQKREATFTCDTQNTNLESVVKAINDFGYTASEKGTD
jgi:copper ion binding protein